jgi:acetylornithine/N-succinyldiaminopimelate aminotransferase
MTTTANTMTAAHTSHLAQVFAQYPLEIAHGDGVWLHTRDGRKILDFYGGHAVAGLGYGHPRWLAALERQARQMAFQTNALAMAVRERAAARLARFAGIGLDTLAFKVTGRTHAVALEQGWHGRTAAAGAVTWGALEKWYGFPRTPFDVRFVPRNDPAAVERFIDRNTAAVIVEPVQGLGGAYDVGKPMLQALRQRCDETGAQLIFDAHRRALWREPL